MIPKELEGYIPLTGSQSETIDHDGRPKKNISQEQTERFMFENKDKLANLFYDTGKKVSPSK